MTVFLCCRVTFIRATLLLAILPGLAGCEVQEDTTHPAPSAPAAPAVSGPAPAPAASAAPALPAAPSAPVVQGTPSLAAASTMQSSLTGLLPVAPVPAAPGPVTLGPVTPGPVTPGQVEPKTATPADAISEPVLFNDPPASPDTPLCGKQAQEINAIGAVLQASRVATSGICARFACYDPLTATYIGADGYRHVCR